MSLILIHTDRFTEHVTPPGHPERPERAEVMNAVASRWRQKQGEIVAPTAASEAQLTRVHTPEYVRRIEATAGRAHALDPDTYTSPESYEIALLAAGAAVDGVDRVLDGAATSALALVRPPGHHAERNRAMGFCLFNNIAVGAAHARSRGASRVAIVDYDVHHGNGTQHMFESDPSVLYVSTHQFPYYPGTGAADEIGEGDGAGFTVNLPLEVGAVDDDYALVFAEVVVPVLSQFKPDILLVSAGFDAHERDPLAGMRLTTPAFAAMTGQLRAVAEECCAGKMVLITEGGYDLEALGASLGVVIETMCAPGTGEAWRPVWPKSEVVSHRGEQSAEAAREALDGYWKF